MYLAVFFTFRGRFVDFIAEFGTFGASFGVSYVVEVDGGWGFS